MARGATSSSSSLLLVLLVAAAAAVTASAVTLDGAAGLPGNLTEELRWAARRARRGWRRARRKAFENGLGRTPQMGYVTLALLITFAGSAITAVERPPLPCELRAETASQLAPLSCCTSANQFIFHRRTAPSPIASHSSAARKYCSPTNQQPLELSKKKRGKRTIS